MKVFKLVKGNQTIHIRIGRTEAEMKKTVDGNADTSVTAMTPLEANRKVNQLLRQGYGNKK